MKSRHEVVAHNTATTAKNKIHDDVIARRYGFGGGLVPGVDVYAYMTRSPAEAWGVDWLGSGWMRARFLTPVYDGHRVVVLAESPEPDGPMAIELRSENGVVCATGEAGLRTEEVLAPAPETWPAVDQVAEPEVASPQSLAPGTTLAMNAHHFDADRAGEYLADVREVLPLYEQARVAHPGWLLRDANHVLSANVILGPWIHVESHVQHFSVVHDGESVQARAVVDREWVHKGHHFVELDVGIVADGSRTAARVRHTAIYRPREPSDCAGRVT